jgi:hypothetical protein
MSKTTEPTRVRVKSSGLEHIAILAEKLAELAILRVPELSVLKRQDGKSSALFDFVVTSDKGVCFFVDVKSYSSFGLKIEPDSIPVLELEVDTNHLQIARRSPTPVAMFLFDGDRGHGRYLRLDTLPKPDDSARTVVLAFPVENTITGDSIRALAAELAKERPVPVAS